MTAQTGLFVAGNDLVLPLDFITQSSAILAKKGAGKTSDYRNTIRLAREVEAVRAEIDAATTPEQVAELKSRVAALHAEVAEATRVHMVKQLWFTRWLWALRLRLFERAGRRA